MTMAPEREDSATASWIAIVTTTLRRIRQAVVLLAGLILLASWVRPGPVALPPRQRPSSQVALDILPVKPGGPAQDFAAYEPSTTLAAPAGALVSVTIRNFDLDAVPLAADSPHARVEGTVEGIAYVDGRPYSTLSGVRIAHTFTVPRLHLNVPIPGASATGAHYVVVTFSFRAQGPGTYEWQCFAPCGDGPDGRSGAMTDVGYMRGSLVMF